MHKTQLTLLGESLWQAFHALIAQAATGWRETPGLTDRDLPDLSTVGIDIQRLAEIEFECRTFEASLTAEFFPSDLMTPENDAETFRTAEAPQQLSEKWEDPLFASEMRKMESAGNFPDVPLPRPMWTDKGKDNEQEERNTPGVLAGNRGVRARTVQLSSPRVKNAVSGKPEKTDVGDWEKMPPSLYASGDSPFSGSEDRAETHFAEPTAGPPPFDERTKRNREPQRGFPEEKPLSVGDPEIFPSVKGLGEFVRFLEADSPPGRGKGWVAESGSSPTSRTHPYPSQEGISDSGSGISRRVPLPERPTLKRPLAFPAHGVDAQTEKPQAQTLDAWIGEQANWPLFQKSQPDPEQGDLNETPRPGAQAEGDSPESFRSDAHDHEKTMPVMPEIDVEQIMETLAREIYREYTRFYGS